MRKHHDTPIPISIRRKLKIKNISKQLNKKLYIKRKYFYSFYMSQN